MQFDMFNFDFDKDSFESRSNENGFTYWYSTELSTMLGYSNHKSFDKAVNKAMTTCNTLGIPIFENFVQIQRVDDGKTFNDFKLSRFACYLAVMNADNKMPFVAAAQAYFATLAGAVNNYLSEADNVERIVIREEVSEREKSLSGVVHVRGIENYGFFQNQGYRGMYNKNIKELKQLKKVDNGRTLLDFMGKEELAANLFRITQTELKIKQENLSGQTKLENAAYSVGSKVRQTMIEISNIKPEDLTTQDDIRNVKKSLKSKSKELKKIDHKKSKGK
jgi:DNA-damage-inducible protein D